MKLFHRHRQSQPPTSDPRKVIPFPGPRDQWRIEWHPMAEVQTKDRRDSGSTKGGDRHE